jgi:enediyne biosynthesis protein E4
MYKQNPIVLIFLLLLLCGGLCSCEKNKTTPLFVARDSKETGLDFENKLTPTAQFNMFHYMYFYNGGGIGAGDFNNDGFIDLFFSSNQSQNSLYLNTGHLKFKNVTEAAHIPKNRDWSTGVSVVDINNDGLLDLYVCKVGNYETLHSKNQFLICQGLDKNVISGL